VYQSVRQVERKPDIVGIQECEIRKSGRFCAAIAAVGGIAPNVVAEDSDIFEAARVEKVRHGWFRPIVYDDQVTVYINLGLHRTNRARQKVMAIPSRNDYADLISASIHVAR
jgi:hypothetical protein